MSFLFAASKIQVSRPLTINAHPEKTIMFLVPYNALARRMIPPAINDKAIMSNNQL